MTSSVREASDRDDIQTDHSARIAHDAASFFTAIRGYANAHARISVPGSKQALYAGRMLEAAVAWLANDRRLLVYQTNYRPQKIPVRVNAELANAEVHLRGLFRTNVDFEMKFDPNVPEIIGDPDSLGSLFSDLARNAAHALRAVPLPEFSIETSHKNAQVIISLSDNGCGMDEAKCAQILAGESTEASTDLTSSGLGMGFVRRTIAQFGGYMKINSAPELGTTFTLYFPAET